ncbi:MAG: sigma-54 factor interaction domain-containing protein, partial [bacterium]|nr:sigma-54 factor interaction domain-containing protein [bacterium]
MRIEDNESTAYFSSGRQSLRMEVEPRERLPPLPALTILAHPDLDRIGDRVLLGELACGRELLLSRHLPRFGPPGSSACGTPLSDPFLSRRPLRLECLSGGNPPFVPLRGNLRLHSDQSRTPVAIDGTPVDGSRTIPVERLDEGVVLEMAQRIVLLLHRHPPAPCEATDCFGLVGESAELEQVRTAIAHVADLDVPVLIRGETGTGKELVA